ncbi:Molybdenum transport ATP-binding protein ModC [Candidatus Rhodobacter oscarellae]|uniref:Molybdenum transport ATP-binding protein ModC n=1 Tax=Candidatus Rhodobacter oscarellae TaxID=1675527 RepID=A0A0J9E6I1_9RHOB|nr:ATP-binding cassette domain-containing protein [Candidatus Rhodobacter lobularis]KMW57434.1 Molybdenum transport ATP-binding protein ModC [Candidatus Rhodobacter lobularis]
MSELLTFDLAVRKPGFKLEAAAEVPLSGITALSGPSGSGKTTLLRALAGLEPSATGRINFAGENWSRMRPARRGVGYVFQDAKLFPHLNVAQNLAYGAIRRQASEELVEAVVRALDLRPLLARSPETLSGGETRRVALGRALASAPRILLMDEPLTGLDRARKLDLMPYIAHAVADFGVPAIYVTHSAAEISFLADRTLFIEDGQLTNWSGAAPRVVGRVVNAAPGQVNLEVGRFTVWVNGQGNVGELWAVPLGQDYLLSTQDPGHSTAALTLPGVVADADPGSGLCQMDIEGQRLALAWPRVDGRVPERGTPVWLSLPRLSARPIQAEDGPESR